MRISLKAASAALAVAAVLTAATLTVEAADEPENIVKYRQNVMKAQGAHISNIAAVVKGEVTYLDNVAADAEALAELSKRVTGLFPPGTDAGKTNALPKIWEDKAGFEDAAQKASEAADAMVTAAASGDVGTIGAALGTLGKACGGCHKPYRKEM